MLLLQAEHIHMSTRAYLGTVHCCVVAWCKILILKFFLFLVCPENPGISGKLNDINPIHCQGTWPNNFNMCRFALGSSNPYFQDLIDVVSSQWYGMVY